MLKLYIQSRVKLCFARLFSNRMLHEEWHDKYVDLLGLALRSDNTVTIFTPDGNFITYDCHHLTPSGVCYYSKLLFDSRQ